MSLSLHDPVSRLKGIGPAYARALNKQEIHTLSDFLHHFPYAYIDPRKSEPGIRFDRPGIYRIKKGSYRLSRIFHRRLTVLKIEGHLKDQPVRITFFNQPYLAESIEHCEFLLLYGTWKTDPQGHPQLTNPLWIPSGSGGEIFPLYAPLSTLKPGLIRRCLHSLLDQLHAADDPLPSWIRKEMDFPEVLQAFRLIHHPGEKIRDSEKARQRFSYEEFLFYHLELERVLRHFRGQERIHHFRFDHSLKKRIDAALPFTLTPGQEEVFADMIRDLLSPHTMTRLLQGEVGSGKTVIAFLALLMAVHNGFQGAFLAPTGLLAAQHASKARVFFKDHSQVLLTGSTPTVERRDILRRLETGEIDLLIGTHALLQENVRFRNLSLIVIDEQHRFGVAQRAALYAKGRGVDVLATTATPIPRTLQLSLYRDMDCSRLSRKGRYFAEITTDIVRQTERELFYGKLAKRVAAGEKGYIILPLIEESREMPDLKSLSGEKEYFEHLFKKAGWGMMSGRTSASEKVALLERFQGGIIKVLAATTVVEVGIDVADASFIVIENADRYGLAQLHQMRGRVGRGTLASACHLIASLRPTEKGVRRLRAMRDNTDGFRIAELDLEMRGGGMLAGLAQYGMPVFRTADPEEEPGLFARAEEDAKRILNGKDSSPAIDRHLAGVEEKLKILSFS